MATLKITCDRDSGKRGGTYQLNSAQLSQAGNTVFLTLDTDKGSIKYRLCVDANAPSSIVITQYLKQEINTVMSGNGTLYVRENPVRDYLHIGHTRSNQRKFEGQRQ